MAGLVVAGKVKKITGGTKNDDLWHIGGKGTTRRGIRKRPKSGFYTRELSRPRWADGPGNADHVRTGQGTVSLVCTTTVNGPGVTGLDLCASSSHSLNWAASGNKDQRR